MERFVERRACPACGELRHEMLRSAAFTAPEVWEFIKHSGRIAPGDLEGGLYQVRRCDACRFLWQPSISTRLDGRAYETLRSLRRRACQEGPADVSLYDGYAREISSIARRLERKPHQLSLLDFGMGWGAWCRMAQAYGYAVAGFELSQRRRENARRWGIRVVDSLEALERYDYINCHHALEHVPDPHQTLARLVAALAPGGLVRLSVRTAATWTRLRRTLARGKDPCTRRHRTASERHARAFGARAGCGRPEPAPAATGMRAFAGERPAARASGHAMAEPRTTRAGGGVAVCGILGQIESEQPIDPAAFARMLATLAARGPDGSGTRILRQGRVALGHRRLAILDLSEHAAQPMTNEDGTLWLTFNGEIYNFRELRKQLEAQGHRF